MTKRALLVVTVLFAGGCKKDGGGAGAPGVACFVAAQDRCKEVALPSASQREAITVECSSASGALSSPAACPTAGFVGKCTVPDAAGGGAEVRRWYKAADATYQQDFCVTTAKGAWSTAF